MDQAHSTTPKILPIPPSVVQRKPRKQQQPKKRPKQIKKSKPRSKITFLTGGKKRRCVKKDKKCKK